MRIFSRPRLRQAATDHPDAANAINAWYKVTDLARWRTLHEVRCDFPHADRVDSCVVFNIRGNHYRLITRIFYVNDDFYGHVYILDFLTHAEYDEGKWKKHCDCE
jgi:mRNA interferase HigB